MHRKMLLNLMLVVSVVFLTPFSQADAEFNFQKSTPIGSWSIREDWVTDHKGKKSLTVIKQSLLGEETVDGTDFYWIEMEMQAYKVKKEKRKKRGDKNIVKVQIARELFHKDPGNTILNFSKHARTMIIQNGKGDPMIIEQGGALAQAALSAANVSVEYDFSEKGTSNKSVPAGSFACKLVAGSGSAESKIVFKTIKVQSETESCFSSDVPFGLVHAEADMVTNGKQSTSLTRLMEFGKSGAKSAITKEPVEMPKMPKLL